MRIVRFLFVLLLMAAPLRASDELAELRAAAEQGDPWAQLNLGAAYDNGMGVAPDATLAIRWYRRAAEQGVAPAQFNLGHSYAMGHGVVQDYTQAVHWLTLAGKQGMAEAQFLLAVCYRDGLGVNADRTEMEHWLRQALAQRHQPAIDYVQRHQLTIGEQP